MCKQHGHSYIFPSGRLDAVSTILLTLWIPPDQVLGLSRPFRSCSGVLLVVGVCGVVCVCVCVKWFCCLVCMWRLMVLRRLQQPRSVPPDKIFFLIIEGNCGSSRLSPRGRQSSVEGIQVKYLKNLALNLGRGQNSVQREAGVESISNLCYSLRCCC